MPARQSAAVDRALRELSGAKGRRRNFYRIAAKHGIAPSTLYRAARRNGLDKSVALCNSSA